MSAALLDDRFAPVTSSLGFLEAGADEVLAALVAWRGQLHGSVPRATTTGGGWGDWVEALQPLTTGVIPRELVIPTADARWSAVVDCSVPFGNEVVTVSNLSRVLGVQGLAVRSTTSEPASDGHPVRFGSRQFQLFGPLETDVVNYVRTVSVTQDGSRWRFDARGLVQEFENTEAYERRRVQDRFTPQMLVDYCGARGLRPFDETFYVSPATQVDTGASAAGGLVLSLAEAQLRWGIVPGRWGEQP